MSRTASWRLDLDPSFSREEATAILTPTEILDLDTLLAEAAEEAKAARRRQRNGSRKPSGRPRGRPKLTAAEAEAAAERRRAQQAAWLREKRARNASRPKL